MIYLILDTNIWVYLANGLDPMTQKHQDKQHFDLLKSLKELKENGDIKILINDIILKEWIRNKHNAMVKVAALKKKLESPNDIFNSIAKYTTSNLDQIKTEYLAGIEKDIQANEEHINNVEEFLNRECLIIEISQEIKLKMFDLSINNQAPFHNKKNNIADATILFSAADYLEEILYSQDCTAIFVSNNVTDFTDGKSTDRFHPEILTQLKAPSIKYQRVLPGALNLSKEIIIELEEFYRQELWLETNSFACRTYLCEGSDAGNAMGYLSHQIPVVTKSGFIYDPNQLNLFPEMPITPKIYDNVRFGECNVCYTPHMECPHCKTIFHIEDVTERFECDECNEEFELDYENSPDSPRIIVIDTE